MLSYVPNIRNFKETTDFTCNAQVK
ncbi:hypothetical protein TNIN_130161, partial [Trichonephila inaurata madagascariensis]